MFRYIIKITSESPKLLLVSLVITDFGIFNYCITNMNCCISIYTDIDATNMSSDFELIW